MRLPPLSASSLGALAFPNGSILDACHSFNFLQTTRRLSPYEAASRELVQLVKSGEADRQRVGELTDVLLEAQVPFRWAGTDFAWCTCPYATRTLQLDHVLTLTSDVTWTFSSDRYWFLRLAMPSLLTVPLYGRRRIRASS